MTPKGIKELLVSKINVVLLPLILTYLEFSEDSSVTSSITETR